MRVRVTKAGASDQVTQVVHSTPVPQIYEGTLLQARIGHLAREMGLDTILPATTLQDGLRAKARLIVRFDDGDHFVSAAVRSYGHTTHEIDGQRTACWEVYTQYSKYRLEVLPDFESAKTPVRQKKGGGAWG